MTKNRWKERAKTMGQWLIIGGLSLTLAHIWQTRHLVPTGERVSSTSLALPVLPGTPPMATAAPKRLVYFFAPWCGVCHANVDNLGRLARWSHSREMAIVLVALDYQTQEQVAAFMAQHDVSLPILLGNAETAAAFHIEAYPSYYVLGEDNTVLAKAVGYSPTLTMWLRLWLS